ncbi:hypothetical protein [Parvularcula dongshanensis]|uniref:Uncharacterized protein n=1 Tax=Parvularcula dongshanensis TaxID=1173995 RepID=A0A840I2Y9_9PROT|nr:hypothetical protein [Parvularcula dongshanensis]MBB4658672.1 hypothetical protein [Parvularcula dongshanensis]
MRDNDRAIPAAVTGLAALAARQLIKRHPIGRAALLAYGAGKLVQAARQGSDRKPR